MSATSGSPVVLRPVPRWVRASAVVTVVLAAALLAVGGFVTSFRAGMADPVWPTEPWYLADNFRLDLGYLVEHTHRIFGWVVGVAVTVLAVGAWCYEPNRRLRYVGLAVIAGLLVQYGEFHRGMGRVWGELKATAAAEYGMDPAAADFDARLAQTHLVHRIKNWPIVSGAASAVLAGALLTLGTIVAGSPGGRVRAAAAWALVCVMVQGLLGGFRVFLNARMGTDLAAVHGAFGQVAFCVLVAAAVLAAPRWADDAIEESAREPFARLARVLAGVLLVQLVWAVMLRHTGTPLSQRLHVLTAFAATGVAVWLVVRLLTTPAARPLRGSAVHLLGVLAVQLTLGVEAYMGKFAATGPQAQTPPMLRQVTPAQAATRTAHQLVGAGLLASVVAVALRSGLRPVGEASEPEAEPEPVAVAAAH